MASVTGSLFQGVRRNSWEFSDPGVGASALRNDRSEIRIRQYVDPGRGSDLVRRQRDHIFASIAGKTTQSIIKNQFTRSERLGVSGTEERVGASIGNDGSGRSRVCQLFGQCSVFIGQDKPGHGLE